MGPEFPEGATWTIKDDLLIISADNGFEMQLDLSRLSFENGERSAPEEIKVTKTYKYDENGALITGETDENDPNVTVAREETITHTVGTRTWKSVSIPSDKIPGLEIIDNKLGDYEIESITFDIGPDGKIASWGSDTVTWKGDIPDGQMNIVVKDNQMTITLDNGASITVAIADEYIPEGGGSVTFSMAGVPALTIDATGIGPMRLQVGANEGQVLSIDIPAVNLKNMGIEDIDVSTSEGALDAIARIDGAVHFVSSVRGRLGAYQNRLESTINNLDVITENITAAYSRIMDVDMAEEMTKYTTYQVLTQAGTSMLAQANERPSQVLQLLQ